MQLRIEQIGPSIVQQVQTVCNDCGGKGERIAAKDRCKTCDGKKISREKKILEVHIDKGMEDGQRISFSGEGDMEPGLEEAGDIIVVLDEKEHETFKRLKSEDLLMTMELTLTEALCGFQRGITTLDSRTLVVSAIPGEVIKHGAVKCIHGEGMPRWKNPYEKGKLIVQFVVHFPDKVDAALVPRLEKILPKRPDMEPPGPDAEEVHLMDIDMEREQRARGRREMYEEDEREGPAGVQCASH